MKIVQITTAHVQQGEEPDLFGLDEQGNVYIYRRAIDPWVTKEYQPPPVLQYPTPELLADIDKCIHNQIGMDPRIEQFGQGHSYADKIQQPVEWLAAPAPSNPFLGNAQVQAAPVPEWLTAEQHKEQIRQSQQAACKRYYEAQELQRQKAQAVVPAPRYKDVYHDGCTEGWEPLKMTISKTVPHKDDPTRCERC